MPDGPASKRFKTLLRHSLDDHYKCMRSDRRLDSGRVACVSAALSAPDTLGHTPGIPFDKSTLNDDSRIHIITASNDRVTAVILPGRSLRTLGASARCSDGSTTPVSLRLCGLSPTALVSSVAKMGPGRQPAEIKKKKKKKPSGARDMHRGVTGHSGAAQWWSGRGGGGTIRPTNHNKRHSQRIDICKQPPHSSRAYQPASRQGEQFPARLLV